VLVAASFLLACSTLAQESDQLTLPVINVRERKAELFAGTGTSDGRFALAWTLRPLKDAEPVDWSLLQKDREKFRDSYSDDDRYFVEILVVDAVSQPDGPTATIQGSPILSAGKDEQQVSTDVRFLDADHRLNQVYEALRAGLSGSERERLKKEELAWINQRNGVAQEANGKAQEASLENPTAVADRELVKVTSAAAEKTPLRRTHYLRPYQNGAIPRCVHLQVVIP
jgi:uncharacterized protein YecT (DUF1311 family)